MARRPVIRMGDPRLKQISRTVETFGTLELSQLIQDMRDTMEAENGAGLAAIQINVPLRVVIFGFEHNPRYPEVAPIPQTVLINPVLEFLSKAQETAWEGCLSVPGLRGLVPRNTQLRYRGYTEVGSPIDQTVTGFHARVVQHEVDHLDGILYPMRMADLSSLGFLEELTQSGALESCAQPCDD